MVKVCMKISVHMIQSQEEIKSDMSRFSNINKYC